jgi:hypothetical protein
VTYPILRSGSHSTASNDSILKVNFDLGYTGRFSLNHVETLFEAIPDGQDLHECGGKYDILNDELVMEMDWYTFIKNQGYWWSVTGEEVYKPEGGYNGSTVHREQGGLRSDQDPV